LTLTSAPPFGHIVTDSVYYGDGGGVFTLTGVTTDTLAGLFSLAFPEATDAGATYGLGGATTATRSHPYAFDSNDTFSATLAITATDRAGNQTTQPFHVMEDTGTPTVTIQVPPVAPLRFWVSWLGQDGESGVRDYDVQYKVGASGTWVSWLTNTPQTEAPFVGERDQSYYFRVQATDNVNNTSAWVEAGPVTVSAVTKYYYHGGQRVAMRQGDVVYYLHSDHLGSTSLTTDITGTLVAETRYLPYGEERWITGTLVTDFTFTGQPAEAGFRLMDYNARYYDPWLGRFISADTLVPEAGNPQALNRYSYAVGNPLKYADPTGHCWDPLTGSADKCIAAWQRTIDAYEAGERSVGVLALHASGITDRLVETSEKIDQLNADAEVVFSNAPLKERLFPSARLGVWATTTAAAIVGAGQLGKASMAATGVANPVPNRMARVVPLSEGLELSDISTLAHPADQYAFVTAADDIAGITTSRGLAERLTLVDDTGALIEGPYAVFEFNTPASGIASPVFRSDPGFIPGGLTKGGAREFSIPNSLLSDLQNLVARIIE
jgi:RHS repeat-associated protein